MLKKCINLILFFSVGALSAQAIDINDFIKPANPLETSTPIEQDMINVPQKATLTRNDIHNQYAIALNRYIQSNVKASYTDFKILIESTNPSDYIYMQMADKMSDLGFFDLSELAISKINDEDISYLLVEDVKRFYFPKVKLTKEDEIYLAEMYSNIIYNDQSNEVTDELIKNTELLQRCDYANYIAALGFFKSGRSADAVKYINSAVMQNPENINYKKLKAEILSQGKKPQDALKIVSEIKSKPMLTTEFCRKVESIEEYILYKVKKNEFEKKYHLARYFYLEGELNKAMRTLQTAFNTKKSNNKQVYALLSRVYFDLKEYEKAEDNAFKAYKMGSSSPIMFTVLGDLAMRKEDYKNAQKYYALASSKNKNSYEPLVKLAKVYQKEDKLKKANEVYSKILKTHSDAYEAYYEVALLDKSREVEYLKKTLAINSAYKDAWIDLARVSIDRSDFDLASNYLAVAKYIDENDFRYYYYLGLVYKNKGLTADAKRNFRKSLNLNPDYVPAKEELSI